jgi:hypothetical protein
LRGQHVSRITWRQKSQRHARGDEARKLPNRFSQQAPCQCGFCSGMLQHDAFVGMALPNRMHDEFSYTLNRVNAESRGERRMLPASLAAIATRYRPLPRMVKAHL